MTPLTLFKAYQRVVSLMDTIEWQRGSIRGIHVQGDYLAKRWQRRDRQARKLSQRIREALGGEFHATCYLCGFYRYACQCKLGYRPRSE